METTCRRLRKLGAILAAWLTCQVCTLDAQLPSARTPDTSQIEVGVVYYRDGSEFSPIDKLLAQFGGRTTRSATLKGANSALRLPAGQPQTFLVCGVDPSRYKLYVLRSSKDSRFVVFYQSRSWALLKDVLAESEVPVTIQASDSKCFTIVPKELLNNGEYGFMPVSTFEIFPFGVGPVTKRK